MKNLRLQHGGAYTADIGSLCDEARKNANNVNLVSINTSCGDASLELLMNLAYSANVDRNKKRRDRDPNLASASLSLYVVGFRNKNNIFIFDDVDCKKMFKARFPDTEHKVLKGINGSYKSLGFENGFGELDISCVNLESSVANISSFCGEVFTIENKESMTRLLISSSEAVRSRQVCNQFEPTLAGSGQYKPQLHWDVIPN